MTQTTMLFLRRMARSMTGRNDELRKLPILQYLSNVCKVIMLNEYEIAVWHTFVKRLSFNVKSVENLLLSSAYLTKELLSKP